ncbi:MAG: biotin/lipoate A/B protein ligase family protein [Armatimonadota bacterium]
MSERDSKRVWRLIRSGSADAFDNMAVDEAILLAVADGASPPTLRLYGWRPPGVSLGYFQPLDGEIDERECRRRGYDIVRRPTGGRAILHDDEVTYSVCVRQADIPGGDRILSSYRYISAGIEAGLAALGIAARLGPAERRPGRARGAPLAACFAKPARADMVVDGRKIVGSAQTRRCGARLQHGSVPLHIDAEAVAAVMPGRPGGHDDAAATLLRAAAGASDVLGRRVEFEEMCEAIAEGFRRALGAVLVEDTLSAEERALAEELRTGKYATPEWNRQPRRRRPTSEDG